MRSLSRPRPRPSPPRHAKVEEEEGRQRRCAPPEPPETGPLEGDPRRPRPGGGRPPSRWRRASARSPSASSSPKPPPPRLRQPGEGPAHDGEGSGRQLARRLRRGGHPPRSPRRDSRDASAKEGVAAAPSRSRFRVIVEDNGPGIVKAQIPKIFAKLLYGSKFHRLKQSRGQQGIGISAAGLYGQLTTGKPVLITSKTGKGRPAFQIQLRIDTKRNQPDVVATRRSMDRSPRSGRATRARHAGRDRARRGVPRRPHGGAGVPRADGRREPAPGAHVRAPKGERLEFPRVTSELPREAQEIKPHPHGVELGMLHTMLSDSEGKTVKQVLVDDFSRISPAVAAQICQMAKVNPKTPRRSRPWRQPRAAAQGARPGEGDGAAGDGRRARSARRSSSRGSSGASRRPSSTSRRPATERLPRQSVRRGGGARLRRRPSARRAGRDLRLREPRAAPVPAEGLRDQRGVYQTNWRGYELQQPKGGLPVGADGDRGAPGERVGPVHERGEGGGRPLRRAHQGGEARDPGVRSQARRPPARARARASARPSAAALRAVHPRGGAAISEILGVPKGKAEKSFNDALPNFVRIADESRRDGGSRRRAAAPPAASRRRRGGAPHGEAGAPARGTAKGGRPRRAAHARRSAASSCL